MDFKLSKDQYSYLHEGLKWLLMNAQAQADNARRLGINDSEFLDKQHIIQEMLDYVGKDIKGPVSIEGISGESLSILKAAALENIKYLSHEKERQKQVNIKKALSEKINKIQALIDSKFEGVELDVSFSEENVGMNPIIFISYATEELALADFIRNILLRWVKGQADIFVAKRDIPSGSDPRKVMLEDKLKNAKAIIPICSLKSKSSPWVWWESSAVWAKDNKIYPLFTNISPGAFGAPLTLVSQGKDCFVIDEFIETLQSACTDLKITVDNPTLTSDEVRELKKLEVEYSKPEMSAKVEVTFGEIEASQQLHKYSFIMDIENKTQQKLDDVVVELLFPEIYLERKDLSYQHLRSIASPDNPEYQSIFFTYSELPAAAKSKFGNGLLPGKKLRVFGPNGLTNLVYEMDRRRHMERSKFSIQWKIYINGGAPIEGSIPLDKMQGF